MPTASKRFQQRLHGVRKFYAIFLSLRTRQSINCVRSLLAFFSSLARSLAFMPQARRPWLLLEDLTPSLTDEQNVSSNYSACGILQLTR